MGTWTRMTSGASSRGCKDWESAHHISTNKALEGNGESGRFRGGCKRVGEAGLKGRRGRMRAGGVGRRRGESSWGVVLHNCTPVSFSYSFSSRFDFIFVSGCGLLRWVSYSLGIMLSTLLFSASIAFWSVVSSGRGRLYDTWVTRTSALPHPKEPVPPPVGAGCQL